jgi:hypothetical protein
MFLIAFSKIYPRRDLHFLHLPRPGELVTSQQLDQEGSQVRHSRIALAAAAATSGLFVITLLQEAVAFADDINLSDLASYTYDPTSPLSVTGLYNMTTAPPGTNESIQSYGEFNVLDSSGTSLGTFSGYESTAPYLTPNLADANSYIATSQVIYVDSAVPGGTTGDLPDGSLISILHSFPGIENVYTAIPGADGVDTVSYTIQTPFGTIDLSDFVNALGSDASKVAAVLPEVPGDTITAVDDPTITAVSGLAPATVALQGVQELELNGNPDATFNAVETTTEDLLGNHTEAFLVTSTDGALPYGTIYNVIDAYGLQNVYSSVPQADGTDKITDTLYDPSNGQTLDLSSLYAADDASAGLADGSSIQPISFGDGLITAAPDAKEVFTGVNGLPPLNASIQGTDLFDLYQNGADTPSATFTADVTTLPETLYFHYSEALLVTDSSDPTLIPDGSVFDVVTYGSGYETIYSDLPGLGADGNNLITDTLVTPFGNIDLSSLVDASAGLSPGDGLVDLIDTSWFSEFFPNAATTITDWLSSI